MRKNGALRICTHIYCTLIHRSWLAWLPAVTNFLHVYLFRDSGNLSSTVLRAATPQVIKRSIYFPSSPFLSSVKVKANVHQRLLVAWMYNKATISPLLIHYFLKCCPLWAKINFISTNEKSFQHFHLPWKTISKEKHEKYRTPQVYEAITILFFRVLIRYNETSLIEKAAEILINNAI